MASREMRLRRLRWRALVRSFLEEARVFDGDTGFAGEDAKQFEMAFVEGAFVVGEYAEGADGRS